MRRQGVRRPFGTISTGAGFNVTVTRSARTMPAATAIASRVEACGLAGVHAGPRRWAIAPGRGRALRLASTKPKACSASLPGRGSARACSSTRASAASGAITRPRTRAGVPMRCSSPVAGGSRSSIEMPVEPRHVLTRDLDVEGGDRYVWNPYVEADLQVRLPLRRWRSTPVPCPPPQSGRWNAPAGVALFHDLSIEHVGHGDSPFDQDSHRPCRNPRAPTCVSAGRRLYIDLWPLEATHGEGLQRGARRCGRPRP